MFIGVSTYVNKTQKKEELSPERRLTHHLLFGRQVQNTVEVYLDDFNSMKVYNVIALMLSLILIPGLQADVNVNVNVNVHLAGGCAGQDCKVAEEKEQEPSIGLEEEQEPSIGLEEEQEPSIGLEEEQVPSIILEEEEENIIALEEELPGGPSRNLSDVGFLLWTRSNEEDNDYYKLYPGNLTNLQESPFNATLPTHVMYHGFNGNGKLHWILNAKTVLLNMYDYNVISVDWEKLVPSPWYLTAIENTFKVANLTASMLDWIHDETGLQPSQIHIVGHSLGAHAAGLTGKYVTSGQVARVTGLDPAGPLFDLVNSDHRIDKSDAAYVDIIHTNGGYVFQGRVGLLKSVGDADFFPNGGHHQPGCKDPNGNIIDDWKDMLVACSHNRVTSLWVESFTAVSPNEEFTSWPCSDYKAFINGSCPDCGQGCLNMGYHVNQSLKGNYYLRTKAKASFAQGDHQ